MVDHEWEVMQAVREKTEVEWRQLVNQDPKLAALEPPACGAVGLASAYQELTGVSAVGGRLALKLYETHGLPVDVIEDLSQVLGNIVGVVYNTIFDMVDLREYPFIK